MKEFPKTKWEGLWQQREAIYSGKVIKKADIPPYSRLIVRYNKYYEKDSNKPRFVYCFASGDAAKAITLEIERDEYVAIGELEDELEELRNELEKLQEMRCFTDEQLQRLINEVACSAGGDGEYGMHIISDFVTGCGIETAVY